MIALPRRAFLAAIPASFALATAARAGGWTEDVGVYTEPTLAPALRAVGRDFGAAHGIGVAVLTAPATLLLEQIRHNAAEDLLIVPAAFMDQAEQRGFTDPATRRNGWHDRLVIAVAAGGAHSAADPAALLAAGPIAVTDATVASSLDGHAVLQSLGFANAAPKIIGVANTADAAFMVTSGAAHAALLFETDMRANPGLALGATLPSAAPVTYSVALNRDPPSKHARDLYAYLTSETALASLQKAGLELAA